MTEFVKLWYRHLFQFALIDNVGAPFPTFYLPLVSLCVSDRVPSEYSDCTSTLEQVSVPRCIQMTGGLVRGYSRIAIVNSDV